jgi:hypothetical protein
MKIAHNRVIASAFYTKNSHLLHSFHFSGMKKAAIHKRIVAAVRVCLYLFSCIGRGVLALVVYQTDPFPEKMVRFEKHGQSRWIPYHAVSGNLLE